ncbi:MAG TPA: DUF2061 domain-containing protein [Ramlibacter sp.]|jgi:uncharacterized membrane protein|nr:DUF2061 domain-containing protein [Ramlibacter sp.]
MQLRTHSSLAKTLSFAVIHLALAVGIGWLLTGTFVLAGLLALVEPAVNTVVAHRLTQLRIGEGRSRKEQALMKSGLLGVSHLFVAVGVGIALGGSLVAMTAYAVLEPLANAVAHYFFDLWWERRGQRALAAA